MKREFNITLSLLFALVFHLQSCENIEKKPNKDSRKINESKEINPTRTLQKSTEISIPTDEVIDEFYDAIHDNDNKKVKQMLETQFPANYEPKNKISPLQALIWTSDNLYLTKLFVEGGANINSEENPLTVIASEYGRLKILNYLIEKGSDIKNNEAFNKAGFHHFYDVAKLLLFNGANQEKGNIEGKLWVFEQAIIKSDFEVLNKLNLTKEEINHNNCNGETALIIAVKQKNLKMVKYLLNKNADKNKSETFDCGDDIYYGKKPIQIARKINFEEIIPLLE